MMFSPHNGMLVEPTEEDIESAVEGDLEVSFGWLNKDLDLPSTPNGEHQRRHFATSCS